MKFKSIKILPGNNLVYKIEELIDNQNRLTKKGAENFLGVLSTLMVNYTNEKGTDWLLKNFDLTLKNRFSLTSTFRIYMMSLLNHTLDDKQKDFLIQGLTKIPFGKNLILDESLHDWLDENIIDQINFYRNMELGYHLIKNSSLLISFSSGVNLKSVNKILSDVPNKIFEEKIKETLQQKIPEETKKSIAIKSFLYDCFIYNRSPKNFPEILILTFTLETKQHLFFYEKNFSVMRDYHKNIVRELYNQYSRNKGKGNDKNLNR